MTTRIVFMGTPDFAVPSLEAVAALPDMQIVCVVTQPDRPAGRGNPVRPSAVKARARELGFPVWTPENLKEPAAQGQLRDLAPDLLVVVAYGEILRRTVLDIPRDGAINVHGSLLPRHRGAAPVAGALLAGDTEAGITIMLMDEGMDTGPMLAQRAIPVRPDHTAATLSADLARLGAALLAETLPRWVAGQLAPEPQDHAAATPTRLLRREHGRLDWTRPARDLANQVRAFDPWPGTFTTWAGRQLKVLRATETTDGSLPSAEVRSGTVAQQGEHVAIATGDGWLGLHTVQLEGKKAMGAQDFVNGYPSFLGSVLGEAE